MQTINYVVSEVECGCGNKFKIRSTKPNLKVDICSECHPFYTQKPRTFSSNRIEAFRRRQALSRVK